MGASLLAVSSSRGTLHIFELTEEDRLTKENNNEDDQDDEKTSSQQHRQRWYDPILSSMKTSKNHDDGTSTSSGGGSGGGTSTKMKIVRSIAKIKCERKPTVIPNTVAMLPPPGGRNGSEGDQNNDDCHVAICFENGKLLVYAISARSSSLIKNRPRPVLADDIMFDSNDAITK